MRDWPHPAWQVELLLTCGPEHASVMARELLAAAPPDLLAVCGGDGTIQEVATGMPDPPFPVAILPAGTANILARALQLPLDLHEALDVALGGVVRRVDAGEVQARQSRRFLSVAGVGFDAYVAFRVRPRIKARIGIAAYYLEVMRSLLAYSFPQFEVTVGAEALRASSCVIANAPTYGGGLVLTPQADMCDGQFDVLILESRSKLDYLRFLLSAKIGRLRDYPWVQRRRASAAAIDGPRGLWAQADGELVGTAPLKVSLMPRSFPLVVPGA